MATRGWEHVTQSDVNRQQLKAAPKPSKYRNVKVLVGNEHFDSKHEAEIWLSLQARDKAGEIYELKRQVRFPLYCPEIAHTDKGDTFVTSERIQVAEYVADFAYKITGDPTWKEHVIDAKSKATRTAVYRLKKKWLELQDGIIIEEV